MDAHLKLLAPISIEKTLNLYSPLHFISLAPEVEQGVSHINAPSSKANSEIRIFNNTMTLLPPIFKIVNIVCLTTIQTRDL
jgi:hypothetical protein